MAPCRLLRGHYAPYVPALPRRDRHCQSIAAPSYTEPPWVRGLAPSECGVGGRCCSNLWKTCKTALSSSNSSTELFVQHVNCQKPPGSRWETVENYACAVLLLKLSCALIKNLHHPACPHVGLCAADACRRPSVRGVCLHSRPLGSALGNLLLQRAGRVAVGTLRWVGHLPELSIAICNHLMFANKFFKIN